MPNPMLQFLNRNQKINLAELISMFTTTFKMAKNPEIALQTLIQNNPQVKKAAEAAERYVKEECDGDVGRAIYKYADQNGVSAEDVIHLFSR